MQATGLLVEEEMDVEAIEVEGDEAIPHQPPAAAMNEGMNDGMDDVEMIELAGDEAGAPLHHPPATGLPVTIHRPRTPVRPTRLLPSPNQPPTTLTSSSHRYVQ